MEVNEGELVAVIGVNGVGKSTFLRTLSGNQPSLDGGIFIKGKERKLISARELASLIAVVFTEQPISENLNVSELVALGRQPYTNWIGTLTTQDHLQISHALKLVQIEEIKYKKCYELSDGQLQKVLIARALAQDTPLIILDEPTSHLDMYHKAQVLKLLKNLAVQTKKSILFATHEINLALQLCGKIILMRENEVVMGSPKDLISKKVFNKMFPEDLIAFDEENETFKIIK